jgi:hypothetical protein
MDDDAVNDAHTESALWIERRLRVGALLAAPPVLRRIEARRGYPAPGFAGHSQRRPVHVIRRQSPPPL